MLALACSGARIASTAPPKEARPSAPAANDLATVEIGLRRTLCHGHCPAYTLTIRGDGSVSYVGGSDVREIGERTGRIELDELRALVARFDALSFLELEDRYAQDIKDAPEAHLSFARDGRAKRIRHLWWGSSLGPQDEADQRTHVALDALAAAIDAAVHSERWTGVEREPRAARESK